MRARQPDIEDVIDHEGVEIGYEVFEGGDGASDLTFLLLPTWTIVHSRFWKLQVPYLARHHRVVTFDGPGNGRSDRTTDPAHYSAEWVADAGREVLDATATDEAILVGLSKGANWGLALAHRHPDRVLAQVYVDPTSLVGSPAPDQAVIGGKSLAELVETFVAEYHDPHGWERFNARHWQRDLGDFAEFWFSECFSEPHSTKQREDCARWSGQTSPEVMLADVSAGLPSYEQVIAWCKTVDHPVLVIHGDDDRISNIATGRALAEATGGELVVLEGAGHIPLARDPVKVNRLLLDFARRTPGHRHGVTA